MELYATKTIKTQYLPATNLHGARIKASDGEGNSATVPYNYRLEILDNHQRAVLALCQKMNWTTPETRPGAYKNNYYWVLQ